MREIRKVHQFNVFSANHNKNKIYIQNLKLIMIEFEQTVFPFILALFVKSVKGVIQMFVNMSFKITSINVNVETLYKMMKLP